MNKFEEEIEKRYGSFELSHDKNKLITDDIKNFTADVAIKFAEWLVSNGIKADKLQNNEICWMKYINSSHVNQGTTSELFKTFINNHYGK
jgi:hypothetical protein